MHHITVFPSGDASQHSVTTQRFLRATLCTSPCQCAVKHSDQFWTFGFPFIFVYSWVAPFTFELYNNTYMSARYDSVHVKVKMLQRRPSQDHPTESTGALHHREVGEAPLQNPNGWERQAGHLIHISLAHPSTYHCPPRPVRQRYGLPHQSQFPGCTLSKPTLSADQPIQKAYRWIPSRPFG